MNTTELFGIVEREYTDRVTSANGLLSPAQKAMSQVALEAAQTQGFPTTRQEEWKYTNLLGILGGGFQFAPETELQSVYSVPTEIKGIETTRVIFVDGHFSSVLSDSIPVGVSISLESARVSNDKFQSTFFSNINGALQPRELVVTIEEGTTIESPIEVVFLLTQKSRSLSLPRLMIVAKKNSRCTIVEATISVDSATEAVSVPCVSISCEEGSVLEYVKLQSSLGTASVIDYTQAFVSTSAKFECVTITLSGSIVRNNLEIIHRDSNSSSLLYGLAIAGNKQVIDNHTVVDHAQPHCESNQLYKHVLGGSATGVFNGKIFVREDAQKTNAYQSNRTILLSDNATINTKPQLEIFADDVKCSHGATTGQLDPESLFYCQSRGIGKSEARILLTQAFVLDVIDQISNESLRAIVQEKVIESLSLVANSR